MSKFEIVPLAGSNQWADRWRLASFLEEKFPKQDITDFVYACEYNDPGPMKDSVGIISFQMIEQGFNDGGDWKWVVMFDTGEVWMAVGGCDYTGWDCQSWLEWTRLETMPLEII